MAAVTGKIEADFSQFETEVKKAEVSLRGMEAGAAKVAVAIDNMSEGTTPGINSLRDSFGQVDQVLAASGVNIGKYVRGLSEIAEASGKSAGQIGLMGTAGLVAGAAITGWQIGRAIADFFELDTAIAKATASLMGWGDVAAEVGGAKQDTINRAIAAGAAATISYADAIQYMVVAEQKKADAYAVSTTRLAAAQREVRGLSAATIEAIAIAQQAGATQQEITRHFNISADALRVLAEEQREAAKATKEHEQAQLAMIKNYTDARSNAMKRMHAEEAAQMEAAMQQRIEQEELFNQLDIKARLNRQQSMNEQAAADAAAEERRIAANQADIDRILAAGPASTGGTAVSARSQPGSALGNPGGFASVMNSPPSIVINAQGALLNNPNTLNELARMVEDALARRGSLGNTYTRR
jgi:hypothetical protein